jgi:hypothetical protein
MTTRRALTTTGIFFFILSDCQHGAGTGDAPHLQGLGGPKGAKPPQPAEQAPSPSKRLGESEILPRIDSYFAGQAGRRIYVQVDKPIYQPGETIWVKTWDLKARDLSGVHGNSGIRYQLVSPKGSVVVEKRVKEDGGMAENDFVIPEGVQGGEYLVRAIALDGPQAERPVIVNTYEAPRIKKKLEFLRKAYGTGDEVTATVEVKRPTGEPLRNHPLTATVRLDDQDLPRVDLRTGDDGGGLVRFTLPGAMQAGDGLLTVLVEDAGVTESISKRIPIVLAKVQFALFPEGGDLVTGLPSRVYFEAKNSIGKPADVEGRVIDDHGNTAAHFRSHHQGLGRFDLTPASGRSYQAVIEKPVGVKERFALPQTLPSGCVLRSYDDLDGMERALRLAVRCTQTQKVTAVAVLRENVLDTATVEIPSDEPAVVYLAPRKDELAFAQGIARVTVFDANRNPIAERLVYRNRRRLLGVKVTAQKKAYTPRAQVTLDIVTTDPPGKRVPAELGLSVVDDTVVSFADDKTGHLLSRLYLEPELPDKVEEPNTFFDLSEEKSALAMDLLMGTRGWRRFEWQAILAAPPPSPPGAGQSATEAVPSSPPADRAPPAPAEPMMKPAPRPMAAPPAAPPRLAAPAKAPRAMAAPQPAPDVAAKVAMADARRQPVARRALAGKKAKARGEAMDDEQRGGGRAGMARLEREAVAERPLDQREEWAVVRVFPAPAYTTPHAGPRTDFRETLHWAPRVRTDQNGTATVRFYLSDAVTSFRVFAEGAAAGLAGRQESVIKSSLPFSMAVKLPMEVSEGDRLRLPLILTNETEETLEVTVEAGFGQLLTLREGEGQKRVSLPANQRTSLFYAVEVTGKQGKSEVRFAADAGNLKDEFKREVVVAPLGFPQELSRSGEVKDRVPHDVDLGQAIPGTIMASVRLYPSPVSSMVSGLEGMLQQPSGCFEQASSTNYPNVMIMRYLKEHNVQDVKLLEKSNSLLTDGYGKLTGYESKTKGFEWFGADPGHEALSAYGLLEFVDMKQVYGGVSQEMIQRTAAWLRSRRDQKGGFLRNSRALDSFGQASPEVTDAYLTYSLVEAGQTGLDPELGRQADLAKQTKDPYLLGLAANTLLRVPAKRAAGAEAASRLAAMQGQDGAWTGANHSITRSGGVNLTIETTALAVLALTRTGGQVERVRRAMTWLNQNRGGYGQWGATQATVLGLRAMLEVDRASRKMTTSGQVTIRVQGKEVGRQRYEAGRREPLLFEGIGRHFASGKNTLEVIHGSQMALPYSVALSYRSLKPATSPKATIDLETKIERQQVKMGESVRVTAKVSNKTDQGQPMTLVRVGLPGGLSFQTWQLKELRDKNLIAFYETRAREVILYFRQLEPKESRAIPLDLLAAVPGDYTGPASNAYLYYTDEHKTWTDPLQVQITP